MKNLTTNKELILLVDDVPTNLHVLVSTLKDHYRLKTATSGDAALKSIAQEKPDLILLDVMMPGMSGIDVMRILQQSQETRGIAVIFVSADTTELTQLTGLELGADDYLTKPISTTVLKVRVSNLLERKRAEAQLRLAAQVFESSGEAIMITDKNNCVIEINQAFTKLTGYSIDEIKGKDPKFLSAGKTHPEVYIGMWQELKDNGFWQGELWDVDKNGRVYPKYLSISVVKNAYNDIDFYIASFTDISERKEAEEHINRLAKHDSLTGLLNRFSLMDGLEQTISIAKRQKTKMAVMFIDMDRFKIINDTFGHETGDALLKEVANRIRRNVRESDLVCRWGGDEFIIVLNGVESVADVTTVATKLQVSLGQNAYYHGTTEMNSSPSIGITMYPDDGIEASELMRNADAAMYHAKSSGRNNFQFYSGEMNRAALERLHLEKEMRSAQDLGQYQLYFQPKYSAKDLTLIGFEALIRWRHPTLGMVPPLSFIPIAEENGMISQIGLWVLEEACKQVYEWKKTFNYAIPIAINLSAYQLRSTTLLSEVNAVMQRYELSVNDLELEITESVAMRDPNACIGQLNALRIMGVQLAIDDFGTGYSSLSYLKVMPVHTLKLDKSFVNDIGQDQNDEVICIAAINLAHSLGLKVVAEGVETVEQQTFLVENDCDILQGYLLGKPAPSEEAKQFILDAIKANKLNLPLAK
ncbi:EAL domain-containing protein [Leeia sp. TBRC 13508]|uniref:EAL domain-containing protein n=1 Tax=Leeia speluncae TaxID=2884804 RepID=A0ABS8D9S3_9NEIS|nr:EAL domain-containing protein [Leeia speluncae]MCB6184924.1 EAL domain-containing protein [Leeia speluncae]